MAFRTVFVAAAEQVCRRATGRKKEKETSWWNERVKNAVREKRRAWQKKETHDSLSNHLEYRRCKMMAAKIILEEKKRSMMELATKLKTDFDGNKKMLYRMVKDKREQREDLKSLKNENNDLISNLMEILNMWGEYFNNL